jgi:hypothetical protein
MYKPCSEQWIYDVGIMFDNSHVSGHYQAIAYAHGCTSWDSILIEYVFVCEVREASAMAVITFRSDSDIANHPVFNVKIGLC